MIKDGRKLRAPVFLSTEVRDNNIRFTVYTSKVGRTNRGWGVREDNKSTEEIRHHHKNMGVGYWKRNHKQDQNTSQTIAVTLGDIKL